MLLEYGEPKLARLRGGRPADGGHPYTVGGCSLWLGPREPTIATWMEPATEAMLAMAGVDAGARVLDLASGAGSQTLRAAKRVGTLGHVVASDIADTMLHYVQESARAAGHANVTTLAGAEDLDVAGSRLSCFTPVANPFMAKPMQILRRHAGKTPPAPGQPGIIALGAPGVIERLFADSGFVGVATRWPAVSSPASPVRAAISRARTRRVRIDGEMAGALEAGRPRASDVGWLDVPGIERPEVAEVWWKKEDDAFARPLAVALQCLGTSVRYDEFSLRLWESGDEDHPGWVRPQLR
jgi:SAM-dependent methyltransferase